jgi:LPS-assembly protein
MTSRIRLIITLAAVSHLILLTPLVTSQLPQPKEAGTGASAEAADKPKPPFSSRLTTSTSVPSDEVVIRAREQEKIGDIYKLRGDVEVTYRRYTVRAENVIYNSDTGDMEAEGGVTFDGGPRDEHLTATHAHYNVNSESGVFYDVIGIIGAVYRGRNAVLTTTNPFMLTGRKVDKIGERYIVYHGTITSCTLPHPKWTFDAAKIDVVAGAEAKMYSSDFRLFGLPIFFFPFMTHSVDNLGRQSGFLLPLFGQSNKKGFVLGDSFYWAANRSTDLTIGAEYFSLRGWSQTGEFRTRPSENSSLDLHYFGVLDRGDPATGQNQSGEDVKLNGEWVHGGWRGVTSLNYLSSFLFRLAWAPTFTQAIDSEVHSNAFLSNNFNGYSFGVLGARYQNFQSINNGDEIRILHMPSVGFSTVDRPVPSTPFTWGFDSSAEGLSRTEPDFETNTLVGRFDLRPRAALPFHFFGWGFRPEIALRDTYYTQQLQPTSTGTVGNPVDRALNRRDFEVTLDLRPPPLMRVFDQEVLGRQIKHVIEPYITYNRVAGMDNFQNVIRFDARDILSDTNEVEFGLINRIYGKRTLPKGEAGCQPQPPVSKPGTLAGKVKAEPLPGAAIVVPKCEDQGSVTRELFTWEIKQQHFFDPTFGNAIVTGQRNMLTSSAEFTGFAFLTGPRNWSPIVSKLRFQPTANIDVQWELDYDTRLGEINASTAFVDYRIGDIFIGGSHVFFRIPGILTPDSSGVTPPPDFNQYRILLGYGHPNKQGPSAGVSFGIDEHFNYLQYAAAQTSYNWDCCGFSFEYRRFTLGSTTIGSVRNENEFRFALTLANIGTFGNMRRQERLF